MQLRWTEQPETGLPILKAEARDLAEETPIFRYPRIPHISRFPQVKDFDSGHPYDGFHEEVAQHVIEYSLALGTWVIEEKMDGRNLGIGVDDWGEAYLQSRGARLNKKKRHKEWGPLLEWFNIRKKEFAKYLWPNLMLFGEWMYSEASMYGSEKGIKYVDLPDMFLAFDVYDIDAGLFYSVEQRDELVDVIGLDLVPRISTGGTDVVTVYMHIGRSKYAAGPMEGVVARSYDGSHRFKMLNPDLMIPTAAVTDTHIPIC